MRRQVMLLGFCVAIVLSGCTSTKEVILADGGTISIGYEDPRLKTLRGGYFVFLEYSSDKTWAVRNISLDRPRPQRFPQGQEVLYVSQDLKYAQPFYELVDPYWKNEAKWFECKFLDRSGMPYAYSPCFSRFTTASGIKGIDRGEIAKAISQTQLLARILQAQATQTFASGETPRPTDDSLSLLKKELEPLHAPYKKPGTGIIHGEAALLGSEGGSAPLAMQKVYLAPDVWPPSYESIRQKTGRSEYLKSLAEKAGTLKTTATSLRGTFEFHDLPPGRYIVFCERKGIEGRILSGMFDQSFELREGEEIEITLVPGTSSYKPTPGLRE